MCVSFFTLDCKLIEFGNHDLESKTIFTYRQLDNLCRKFYEGYKIATRTNEKVLEYCGQGQTLQVGRSWMAVRRGFLSLFSEAPRSFGSFWTCILLQPGGISWLMLTLNTYSLPNHISPRRNFLQQQFSSLSEHWNHLRSFKNPWCLGSTSTECDLIMDSWMHCLFNELWSITVIVFLKPALVLFPYVPISFEIMSLFSAIIYFKLIKYSCFSRPGVDHFSKEHLLPFIGNDIYYSFSLW